MGLIEDVNWDQVRVVRASGIRREILEQLNEHPKTGATLAEELDYHRVYVSRMVRQLTAGHPVTELDDDLVECLNDDQINYRYYTITPEGKQILEIVQNGLP
jgi:DNA-binding MarR family transcriptional regulator